MSTATQMVHFSIEGEFITETCRNLVAEGRPLAAWNILSEGLPDMSLEQIVDVLSGRKKLTGVNEVVLVDDNPSAETPINFIATLLGDAQEGIRLREILKDWRDDAGLCHMAYDPPKKDGIKMRGSPVGLIDESVVRNLIGTDQLAYLLMKIFPKFTEKEREAYFEKNKDELIPIVRDCHRGLYGSDVMKAKEAVAILNPPPRAKPQKGDIKVERYGWILPDGSFYACDYMGHNSLADDLGANGDYDAERRNWIRVTEFNGVPTLYFNGTIGEPTQAQIDTADEFCQARGISLPYWAGGPDV
jgi:hypothetical protein